MTAAFANYTDADGIVTKVAGETFTQGSDLVFAEAHVLKDSTGALIDLVTLLGPLATIQTNTDTLESLGGTTNTKLAGGLPAALATGGGLKFETAAAGAGAVAATTPRVTLASDDPAVAALATIRDATNTINVAQDTAVIKNGATSLTPKFAAIAASSSGNNTLVAAVTGKTIRVLAYNFIGNGAVNAKFQTGAGGTDLTGLKYIAAAGGGICAPFNPVGWFETASATLLNLNLSGAVAVGGEIVYIEV
jgi:hypothetical protein